MASFILRRLLQLLVTLLGGYTLLFLLFFTLPGDPAEIIAGGNGKRPPESVVQNVRTKYHLDEQSPGTTSLRFEQEVRAEAPMFVVASYVARPLLVWNHHRMMRGAAEGLRAKVQPSAAIAAS